MVRIEYRRDANYIRTKWVEETISYSAMLGDLWMSVEGFEKLKMIIEKHAKDMFKFVDKNEKVNDKRKLSKSSKT